MIASLQHCHATGFKPNVTMGATAKALLVVEEFLSRLVPFPIAAASLPSKQGRPTLTQGGEAPPCVKVGRPLYHQTT